MISDRHLAKAWMDRKIAKDVGAQLVGPLPGDLGIVTVFTAGIGAATKSSDAAKALLQFFTGPAAATLLKAKGFAPG
jgi:molybdate transport system substrate-binding protein